MYHSVSFWPKSYQTDSGGRNTWASWRLIPSSRPYITPPTQKTYTQDVPYANGKIDLSELGLDDVVFENRVGSIEFTVMNNMVSGYDIGKRRHDDGNKMSRFSMIDGTAEMWDWDILYSTVMDYMHGKTMKMVLEDDPGFYYIGRITVESLNSEEHFTKIGLNYDVDPYKKQRFSTTEDWVWDAIDFEANPDILGLSSITIEPDKKFIVYINTLRKKVVPTITVSKTISAFPAKVAITDLKGQRVFHLLNGENNIKNPEKENIDDLYFNNKDTVKLEIKNEGNQKIKVEIDYRLEGL